ncbi:hypothetical protein RB598_002270 [Gaeumannomyces tritici]
MLFSKSIVCLLAQSPMLCHAAPRKVLLDRHSIAVDEPNFLDYVSCKEQPKGICTLTLVLTPDGKDMGALVFDNECSKVIGLAHSIHWDEKTAFPPGAFRGDLSVEPRKDGKPTYWLNDEEFGGGVDWDFQEWNGHNKWSEQTTFACGKDESG